MSIGTRIRTIRTMRGLSSAELAKAAGVSRGLISQIELDRANPSIDTLRRVAAALESPIAAFFDDGPVNGIVVRSAERRTMRIPASGLTYQLLTPDLNRQIEFILIELEPGQGGTRHAYGHPGEESALVLEGQLHVWIGEEEHVLEAGDSISFNSGIPHRIANLARKRTVLVSAITPPSF
jgi:transcriptional regulator with XRE-family HTH domain